MSIYEYVKESEKREFCENCNEICSRHCVIYRKAEFRYDEEERRVKEKNDRS